MVTSWLKAKEPAKGPPAPRRIDVAALHRHALDLQRRGPLLPQMAALVAAAPPDVLDRWGVALPLADAAQARLDRIGAVLSDPWNRPRALVRAGQMGPDEVQAMQDGRPDELKQLAAEVQMDMVKAGPPLPQWVESQLAILFQKPSNLILQGGPDKEDSPREKSPAPARGAEGFGPNGTPSDRRELAVRIGKV